MYVQITKLLQLSFFIFRLVWEVEGWFETGLDINVCPTPVKTDVEQVDLVLRLSDGTSETRGSGEPVSLT